MADQKDTPTQALAPTQQDTGITSGPGNQGSSNTAHRLGQAGTGGAFLSVPRSIAGPGIGGGQPQ